MSVHDQMVRLPRTTVPRLLTEYAAVIAGVACVLAAAVLSVAVR